MWSSFFFLDIFFLYKIPWWAVYEQKLVLLFVRYYDTVFFYSFYFCLKTHEVALNPEREKVDEDKREAGRPK